MKNILLIMLLFCTYANLANGQKISDSATENDGIFIFSKKTQWPGAKAAKGDSAILKNCTLIIKHGKKVIYNIKLDTVVINVDKGIRCVKAPCPKASEWRSLYRMPNGYLIYGNSRLCISSKVFSKYKSTAYIPYSAWIFLADNLKK